MKEDVVIIAIVPTDEEERQAMKDRLYLATAPLEESCAQVGTEHYRSLAAMECSLYLTMLCKKITEKWPVQHVNLCRITEQHDSGSVYSIVVEYNPADPVSVEQAFWIEANEPLEWDENSRKQLQNYCKAKGIPLNA